MAFCTKLSGHLKQGVLQNGNVPATSMLGSLRYMSTKLFIGGTDDQSLKEAFTSFNGVIEGKPWIFRFIALQ